MTTNNGSNAVNISELTKIRGGVYITVHIAYWILVILLLLVSVFGWSTVIDDVQVGMVSLSAVTLWTLLSLRSFSNIEFGAVYFFGKPVHIVRGGGLRLVPWLIFNIKRTSAEAYQIELPGEPEEVQKTSDDIPLRTVEIKVGDRIVAKTKMRPIRVVTSAPKGDDMKSNDPLDARLTIEPSFWVRYRVVDPILFDLQLQSPEEAARQLRDVGETILTEFITKETPRELNDKFVEHNLELFTKLKKYIEKKKWGIELLESGLNPFDFKKTVAEAMQKIATAKASADAAIAKARETVTTADAEAYRLEKEGEGRGKALAAEGRGDAEAIRAKLAARGEGIALAAKQIGIEPAQVLAAEVAENTIGEGTVIIGDDGIAKAVAVGTSLIKKGASS